jgi:hypothetical protein
MAKLRSDHSHPPLRGKFGDKIYKWYGNTCVVQKLPARRKRRRLTGKLKAAYDNLRQAVRYAQGVIADPAAHAYYAAAARELRSTVYLVAKSDAMKAPTIVTPFVGSLYKGRAGGVLVIETRDLFRVQSLRITFRDAAGDVVESGDATRQRKTFRYRLKRDHPRGQVLTIEAAAESRTGQQISILEQVSLPRE